MIPLYYIIPREGGQYFCSDDPWKASVYMLGRQFSRYIVIKSDQHGDRILSDIPCDVTAMSHFISQA